jgi:hypothetical protein
MPNSRSGSKPTIVYAKTEIGGITVRPDSRAVMRKAVEGHPIEVHSGNDYINLYHVFERMQATSRSLAKLNLIRKQVGASKWLLFVLPEGQDAPEVELSEGYDPKRGRYKRYAQQLAAGDALRFADKAEAIKARRAWQLYVRPPQRKTRKSSVRRVGKTSSYVVMITDRA